MKIKIYSALTPFLIFLFLAQLSYADIVDRVVAQVNNDVITLSEVNLEGKALLQRVMDTVSPQERDEALQQVRKKIIDKLIEKKLMEQEAEKANISVSDAEVELAFNRILEMNNLTPESFREQLAAMGMDEALYMEDLKVQVLSSKLVNQEIRSKVIIPEEKIIDYYDTHYTKRMKGGGFYLLQIGINWDDTKEEGSGIPTTKEAARQKAEKIRGLAMNGGDFEELAKQNSNLPSAPDGGDIGILKGDDMSTKMYEVISQTEKDSVTPIIETSSGFQFFKVLANKQGEIVTRAPYAAVKEKIHEILYKEAMEERYNQWLEQVKSRAFIKIL